MFSVIAVTFCVNSLSGSESFRVRIAASRVAPLGRALVRPAGAAHGQPLKGERPYFAMVSGVSRVFG